MKKPPFFIPQCDHALLIVNVRALYLLQQHGTPSFPDIHLVAPYASGENERHFLAVAHRILAGTTDYRCLEGAFVTLRDQFEYLYSVVKCGHCSKCLHSKQIDLVNRVRMEAELYETPVYFFTLTYSPKHLPKSRQLETDDVARFFKRLRRLWDRRGIIHNIRYIVAGEYGSRFGRPHYHILLFNNPYGADEFRPWLHNKLRDDIFRAWSKCEPQGFDFGVAGDGAASYCMKYVTKQAVYRLKHRYRPGWHMPFIHQSTKNGGIGAPFIRRRSAFFRDNPSVNKICFTSRHDCSYHEISLGSYAKQILHPSPSRQQPAKVKLLYRQTADVFQHLVNMRALSYGDAWRCIEAVRPPGLPHLLDRPCFISVSPDALDYRSYEVVDGRVQDAYCCPGDDLRSFFQRRLLALAFDLQSDLSTLLDSGRPIDYADYYGFMFAQKRQPDNRGSFAGDKLRVMSEVAAATSRERL